MNTVGIPQKRESIRFSEKDPPRFFDRLHLLPLVASATPR